MLYIASLFVLISSFFLFRCAAGELSLSKPNLISVLYYKDFILLGFIGVVLVASYLDVNNGLEWWGITGHISERSRFYAWLSTMYTILVFPVGMILSNLLILKRVSAGTTIKAYYKKEFVTQYTSKDSAVFMLLVVFLFFSLLSVVYVYREIDNFALLHLIKGADSFSLSQLRSDAKINFTGSGVIRNIFAIRLTVLISLICYSYKLLFNNIKYSVLFYFSFILSFFILTYNLEKAPFLLYLLSLFAVSVIYKGGLNIVKSIPSLIAFFILMFLFFLFIVGSDNALEGMLYRIFIGQTVAIFQGIEYFPDAHPYLGLGGVSNLLASLVGEELKVSGRLLFEIFAPSTIENNTAGYIVGLFNAEAWILFGWLGVLVAPLYIGFIIQVINLYLLNARKSPLFVGFYVYLWTNLGLEGSITQFLYPLILITMFLLFFGILFGAKLLMLTKINPELRG